MNPVEGTTPIVKLNLKSSMIRSNLCDYSDAYIHVKGTITIPNMAAAGVAANNANKKVILKNCAAFTNYIGEINNTKVHDIDVVIVMYNLIKYSDIYSKKSRSLWKCYRD